VMLGSNSDPTAVSSVILTPKPSSAEQGQTVAIVYANTPRPMIPNRSTPPEAFKQPIVPRPGTEQAEDAQEEDGQDAAARWFAHQAEQNEHDDPEGTKQPTPEEVQEMISRQPQFALRVTDPSGPPRQ
jgi:hypothetical protein